MTAPKQTPELLPERARLRGADSRTASAKGRNCNRPMSPAKRERAARSKETSEKDQSPDASADDHHAAPVWDPNAAPTVRRTGTEPIAYVDLDSLTGTCARARASLPSLAVGPSR
jgi:hypothetical protein